MHMWVWWIEEAQGPQISPTAQVWHSTRKASFLLNLFYLDIFFLTWEEDYFEKEHDIDPLHFAYLDKVKRQMLKYNKDKPFQKYSTEINHFCQNTFYNEEGRIKFHWPENVRELPEPGGRATKPIRYLQTVNMPRGQINLTVMRIVRIKATVCTKPAMVTQRKIYHGLYIKK